MGIGKKTVLAGLAVAGLAFVPVKPAAALSIYHSPNYYEDFIIQRESSGRSWAVNPYSKACGLMQAYPCSKLAAVCPEWWVQTECQLNFFDGYMRQRYGTWWGAYIFWLNHFWW